MVSFTPRRSFFPESIRNEMLSLVMEGGQLVLSVLEQCQVFEMYTELNHGASE